MARKADAHEEGDERNGKRQEVRPGMMEQPFARSQQAYGKTS